MRRFRKVQRVDLGTYEAPPEAAPAKTESIVEDALLISESVVRMALRNRVIVDALRDRRDIDLPALRSFAAAEYESFADSEWETAQRVRFGRESFRNDDPIQEVRLTTPERKETERRENVHRAVSDAFAARASDASTLDRLVARSIEEAWLEVGPVLLDRAESAVDPIRDDDYAGARTERTAALIADLDRLATSASAQGSGGIRPTSSPLATS